MIGIEESIAKQGFYRVDDVVVGGKGKGRLEETGTGTDVANILPNLWPGLCFFTRVEREMHCRFWTKAVKSVVQP
jgi:hypothetical protein